LNSLSGRALIIDDEPGIRTILNDYLSKFGLVVDEADDGQTGLEKVKKQKYDYIFTDLKMLNMSGDIFIKQAQQIPNGQTQYYVISAGMTEKHIIEVKEKINGFIKKPFTEQDVYETLTKVS
jgi:CheY-like chemotaxis protein